MNKALLDTDIFSEVQKGRNSNIVTKARAYRDTFGSYTISVITVLEIIKGWHKRQRQDRIHQFLNVITDVEVLNLDLYSAELAGRIYADLERTGQPIGLADTMIAAIAMHKNLTLVTGNLSHYQRIQLLGYKLHLDNWRG